MSSSCFDAQPLIARLDDVWKRYRLKHDRPQTLRERLGGVLHKQANADDFWALRGVSLDVHLGETIGVIGPNGSGKTTILKLLAGISAASRGRVSVCGKCSALIELAAGFHPELSGRENVFLSGAILGCTRAQIAERYQSIVDFAELQHFIDTPVKFYSSGMAMRLGFAIAISVDADLLLVDEALSVGDRSFQEKCLATVTEMQRQRRAFVVVSHDIGLLERVCSRIVWLEKGMVRAAGYPAEVIPQYLGAVAQRPVFGEGQISQPV